jgi:phenylacetate-CoA ligase
MNQLNKSIQIAKRCSYYNNKINVNAIKNLADIKMLPISTKEELRSLACFDALTTTISELYQYHESFGTTGTPVSTWLTKNDFQNYVSQINESPVNFQKDDIALIRFPYAISVPAHIFSEAIQQRGGCIIPASRASAISPYPRVINLMKKLKVTILCSNPFEAFMLAEIATKMGYSPTEDFSLRAICVAGEMLSDARRKRLESVWGVPVYNFYGATETGNLATACSYGNLHCSVKHFLFENLHLTTKEPVEDGVKGLMHITTLMKEAFPMIRYDTGDIVEIKESKCLCGNKAPILIHHGRITDCIDVNGTIKTFKELQEAFLDTPPDIIGDNWKIVYKKDHVLFKFESSNTDYNKDDLKKLVHLDIPFDIEPVKPGEIMDLKELMNITPIGKPIYIEKVN